MQNNIQFRCIQVNQPIGTFYIGAIDYDDLLSISYSDVRRIEDRDIEQYLGIQRPLSPGRVSELKDYVKTVDATFPTSIIISISSEHAQYDEPTFTMSVDRNDKVAKIIDGQHRIAGLENYSGVPFQLNVTVFVDMELEDQATVFSTINLKQTKVSKSLAYDLFEYAQKRSPQKTCHNVVKLLNSKNNSPFKDKIKILGTATGKPQESITQATFVDRLMKFISNNPMNDRDALKRGERLYHATESDSAKLIFRNLFIDGKDAEIAKNLWNFFKAVEMRWPVAWPESQRGLILNRTTGFGALMRFLRPAYLFTKGGATVVETDKFFDLLKIIDISDSEFSPDVYKPGSSGEAKLYTELLQKSGLSRQQGRLFD